jgi:DNA topoisomerase-3
VPSAIADPGTTAVWEQALDMIEAGQMALDTFIEKQSVWVGQLVQQYRGATLAQAAAGAGLPAVRRTDAQRTGKSGAFWSCSRYPDCKGTLPIESPTGRRSAPRKRRAASKAS